jgi:hypothetical protein
MHNQGDKLVRKLGLGKITKRQFIQKTAAGAAGVMLTPWPSYGREKSSTPAAKSRVILSTHRNIIDDSGNINAEIARRTMDETLVALTQKASVKDAWMSVFPRLESACCQRSFLVQF